MILICLLLALLVGVAAADVQCDGVDDLLTSGQPLSAFFSASTWTLAMWINSTGSAFVSESCWSAGPMLIDTWGYLALGRGGADGGACLRSEDVGGGRLLVSPVGAGWHHLAGRLAGGTLTLFVDGTNVASTGASPLADMSGHLRLCGGATEDATSPDRVADVQVFNTALSDDAIRRIASSRLRGHSQTAPTGYWPLDDCPDGAPGNDVTFRDRSGGNRHLTGVAGGNGTGVLCRATNLLSRPWGPQ